MAADRHPGTPPKGALAASPGPIFRPRGHGDITRCLAMCYVFIRSHAGQYP